MKATKIIVTVYFILSIYSLKAQLVKINISDIVVSNNNQQFDATPLSIEMYVGKSTDKISIFKDEDFEIKASYTLKKHEGTRRSSLKKTAIQLKIDYTFYYAGRTERKQKLKTFYINNDRTFQETETIAFLNGISNNLIKISYTGNLPQ